MSLENSSNTTFPSSVPSPPPPPPPLPPPNALSEENSSTPANVPSGAPHAASSDPRAALMEAIRSGKSLKVIKMGHYNVSIIS